MADSQGTSQSEQAAGRDLIRSAAKWFIAGLGAIGAVLIAGSQLSSVGALPVGSGRLWIAVAGVVIGLLAILWAMWRVVDVLASRLWSFEDVLKESEAIKDDPDNASNRRKHPVGWWIRDHPSALGGFASVRSIQDEYQGADADADGIEDLVGLMSTIADKAASVDLDARFLILRRQIAAGVVIGAGGIIMFAWAANPAPAEGQPPPSLRSANLRGADLGGASLRNADLTGADLTGANLSGADLKGATVENTIWSNTICPDGTNSDARARKDANGVLSGATCSGHLLPQAKD